VRSPPVERRGRANAFPTPAERGKPSARGGAVQDNKESQFRKLTQTAHGKPRPRRRRAYAHFGWPRRQPTRILQIVTRRQRRPVDLSCAGAFQDLRLQVRQNPSKGPTCVSVPRRDSTHKLPLTIELSRRVSPGEGSRSAPIGTPSIGNFCTVHQSDQVQYLRVPVRC